MPRPRVGEQHPRAQADCPRCKGFGTVVENMRAKFCPCVPPEPKGCKADAAPVKNLLTELGVAR